MFDIWYFEKEYPLAFEYIFPVSGLISEEGRGMALLEQYVTGDRLWDLKN